MEFGKRDLALIIDALSKAYDWENYENMTDKEIEKTVTRIAKLAMKIKKQTGLTSWSLEHCVEDYKINYER